MAEDKLQRRAEDAAPVNETDVAQPDEMEKAAKILKTVGWK